MDLAEAELLTSARGAALLRAARDVRALEPLARRRALDAIASREEARAVLAADALRARAARKTPLADVLLFAREALEQASPAPVAAERARSFAPFDTVADLGAGIGLDTLALALAGRRVVAVERDPARAALLRHNVEAAGVAERVRVVTADLEDALASGAVRADAAFLDPDRRPDGARTTDPAAFEPPAPTWAPIAARFAGLLVKGAPGARPGAGPTDPFAWASLDGELRESRVGFGAFARTDGRRTAIVLPAEARVEGTGAPWPSPRAPRVGELLLDPDPAVVVAGLLGDAAATIDAAPLHPRIAYLGAASAPSWADAVRIDAISSADAGALRGTAGAHDVGACEIRTRGVTGTPEAWRRRIRPRGTRPATVVLTRDAHDRYVALWSFPGRG